MRKTWVLLLLGLGLLLAACGGQTGGGGGGGGDGGGGHKTIWPRPRCCRKGAPARSVIHRPDFDPPSESRRQEIARP